ncbi:MAG: hypothetical protein COA44_06050 [Arcobacter sp.]|nr:MAG: hypothetical protein COA44_06050 [Arcobacter sp.]
MRIRDQKIKDEKQWIEGYEHNLRLAYDLMKDELKTLHSDKVNQGNTIKLVLWLNIIFVGISIKVSEEGSDIYLLGIFSLIAFFSIFVAFVGLMMGRYSAYASMRRASSFYKLNNDKWIKTQGLETATQTVQKAIRYNGLIIIKRAKLIRISMYITLSSLFMLLILSAHTVYIKQGNEMADKPSKPAVTVVQNPSIKRANDSAPKTPKATPESNSSKK